MDSPVGPEPPIRRGIEPVLVPTGAINAGSLSTGERRQNEAAALREEVAVQMFGLDMSIRTEFLHRGGSFMDVELEGSRLLPACDGLDGRAGGQVAITLSSDTGADDPRAGRIRESSLEVPLTRRGYV